MHTTVVHSRLSYIRDTNTISNVQMRAMHICCVCFLNRLLTNVEIEERYTALRDYYIHYMSHRDKPHGIQYKINQHNYK